MKRSPAASIARYVASALAFVLLPLVVLGLPVGAESTNSAPNGQSAVDTPCAREHGSVHVVMLIDVSLSLVNRDPEDRRKLLIRSWLNDLLSLRAGGADVRLSMLTYGSVVTDVLDWTDLDGDSVDLARSATDALPRDEWDTDHVLGITVASERIGEEASRVLSDGGVPCPVLLWFTDGEFDFENFTPAQRRERNLPLNVFYSDLPITPENEAQIIRQGLEFACGDNGPVLDRRQQGTLVRAVALDPRATDEFLVIQEMADGTAFGPDADEPCVLDEYQGGRIDVVTDLPPEETDEPPTPPETSVPEVDPCGSDGCETTTEIEVPPLSDSFQLAVRTSTAPTEYTVTDPAGEAVRLTAPQGESSIMVADREFRVIRTGPSTSLVNVRSTGGSELTGEWALSAITREPTSLEVTDTTFSSSIKPQILSTAPLESGEPAGLEFAAVDGVGSDLERNRLELVTLDGRIDGYPEPLVVERQSDGRFVMSIPPAATDVLIDRVVLNVLTQATNEESASVRFDPVRIELRLTRAEFPSVVFDNSANGTVRQGPVVTPGEVSIEYSVVGPRTGSGCVTLDVPRAPFGAASGARLTTSAGSTICLDEDERAEGVLTVAFDERRFATDCQRFRFELTSDSSQDVRTSEQDVCVSTQRSGTLLTRALALGLTVLLVLAPLVFLWFLNRVRGRLPSTFAIRRCRRAVVGDQTGLTVRDDDRFLRLEDFESNTFSARGSMYRTDDDVVLRTHTLRSVNQKGAMRLSPSMLFTGPRVYLDPLGDGLPVVVAHGGRVLFSGTMEHPVRVPLDFDGLWIVARRPSLLEEQTFPFPGELIVIRLETSLGAPLSEIEAEVHRLLGADQTAVLARSSEDSEAEFDVRDMRP